MIENSGRISLDVHAHLAPIFPDELAMINGVSWNRIERVLTVDGHEVGMKPLFDPQALVAWMEKNRVEAAWISIPPPLYRPELQGDDARGWTSYVNAGLQRISEDYPNQLSLLPHLPLQAPHVAHEVAQRWISRGHRRFAAPSGGCELVLSEPAYAPLWQALDAANAFVFFHPGECADGRLKSFYLSNLVGNPYESAVAIAHLVLGGVIERHPGIRFCFAHGGGALPALAGRFERGFDTSRPGITTTGKSPRSLLRQICVDCILHDEAALQLAESVFGASNIVFGSDWPFPMGLIDPQAQMTNVDQARRSRIFCDNPDRLKKEIYS
jgi:aminocarboxymuconate-semialdehyde decarboxylase